MKRIRVMSAIALSNRRRIGIVSVSLAAVLVIGIVTYIGTRQQEASRAALPTNPLPFDMPSAATLDASPRKVFAHYFTPYPISLDNQDPDSDYYARNFLTKDGEKGIHASYGGFLRERPLPREVISSSSWALEDMKTEVKRASQAGLDGFTVDILGTGTGNQNWERFKLLLKAAPLVDPNFKLVLMPDGNGSGAEKGYESLATNIASLVNDPVYNKNIYKLSDGRVVVSPFKPETYSATYWKNFITSMGKKGIKVAFVPTFLDYNAQVANYDAFSYGFSNWGNRNPDDNQLDSLSKKITDAHSRGKIWMQPVSLQDNRPRDGIYDEANNTENYRLTWNAATVGGSDKKGAEWVQIPTWNDYSENTQISPGSRIGWSALDLTSYYLAKYKLGSYPTIKRDTIYVSHRNQLHATMPSPLYSKVMKLRSGSSPARNKVEVMAFLTAPGTIKTVVGTKTYSVEAPAGVSTHLFDLSAGTVSATLSRDGSPVATVTSPNKVVTSTTQQNLLYHFVSSGREGEVFNQQPANAPDLVVTNITTSPAAPNTGNATTFSATVKNQGTAVTPVGTILGVSFRVNDSQVSWSDTHTSSLAPGASVTLTANSGPTGSAQWVAVAGTQSISAKVDDINRIVETNDANNTLARSITITDAAVQQPDLVVTNISSNPVNPAPGAATTFSATIKNQGTAATPAGIKHGVSFRINGTPVSWSDTHVASLASGASVTLIANAGPDGNATWTATEGVMTLSAVVDDINRISEANESNNALSQQFTVNTSAAGDVNGDNRVNAIDLSAVLAKDGQSYPPADFNADGIVGAADLAILLSRWTW
ncbi:MAG TPA: endo-1,3-alpha-glucanase family glycosylhydrolase [Candidatus Limnocylindrales bacterium]|nr:endo-1,3-alpha-glucanase family glycosylhydrolase [Candidatus Limnocylindrales bacterium]